MDSEIIYEALGEVIPMEARNGSKMSLDEGLGAPDDDNNVSSMHPLFNQGMADGAVVDYIFNCCDVENVGLVRTSVLVDFLLSSCGTDEMREIFSGLLTALDPAETNPEVDLETFQLAFKLWIKQLTFNNDNSQCLLDLSGLKLQPAQNSNSSISESDSRSSSFSSEPPCSLLDVKELQFQYNRLQEENRLLQEQMVDVEETNVSLRSENTKLKSKISKVELAVSQIDQRSQLLQEDNGQLHGNLQKMKDDLQRMTMHYNTCRSELDSKLEELEILQSNNAKEEEQINHLTEKIKLLEELIFVKEEELITKDKEIQKITCDLLEQQNLCDSALANDTDRRKTDVAETLADELQSSLGAHGWRRESERMGRSDFMHPIAWNVMLNEPEFEDEPSPRKSSFKQSPEGSFWASGDVLDSKAPQATPIPYGRVETLKCMENQPSYSQLDIVHSTPIKGIGNLDKELIQQTPSNESTLSSTVVQLTKNSVRVAASAILIFTLAFVVIGLAIFLVLVTASSSDCSVSWQHHHQASPYYQSSFWSKVIEIIKPYCQIEYCSYPPV